MKTSDAWLRRKLPEQQELLRCVSGTTEVRNARKRRLKRAKGNVPAKPRLYSTIKPAKPRGSPGLAAPGKTKPTAD